MRLVDASSYQGRPNWNEAALNGHVVGAWLKATEGVTTNDPDFAVNRVVARAAGVHVGPYHFAHPTEGNAILEARHFVGVVKKLALPELRPVLDYELPTGFTPVQALAWIHAWNTEVKKALGVWPIFYSYPALIEHLGLKAPVGAGLWIASYGANDGKIHVPIVPKPWHHIVAQQFTSNGHVPGFSGTVDVDEAASLAPLLAHPVAGHLTRPLLAYRRGGGVARPV